MNYYKATSTEDFNYIIELFNPDNTEFMLVKTIELKTLKKEGSYHYILIDKDKKIGWFFIKPIGEFVVIIDKPYQGQGRGKEAMLIIEKESKKLGFDELVLGVHANNKRAVKLYENRGFEVFQTYLKMKKNI
jgi:GNAT superfamily N-acetyltransferase